MKIIKKIYYQKPYSKQWLDDIIEGKKEQELILYQDKDFILLISDK